MRENMVLKERYEKDNRALLKCRTCGHCFSETHGSPFFGLNTSMDGVCLTLAQTREVITFSRWAEIALVVMRCILITRKTSYSIDYLKRYTRHQERALHGVNMKLDLKHISEDRTYLKLILGALFLFYCYLSILPKHWDFYSLSSIAQLIAKGHFNIYEINKNNLGGMYPPLFYFIEGVWIKLGSILNIYNLDNMPNIDGQYVNPFIQFWCMVPYLLILLACALISYRTLKNKWLSILWFGTITFISLNIMGQCDIFASFFILISVTITIKSFYSEKYVLYLYLGLASLGVSTLVKPYGFLLFPLYILIAIKSIDQRVMDKKLKIKIYSVLLILVSSILVSPMLIYGKWVSGIASGGSSWAFNLQTFGVYPFPVISIGLLGYCIIIYVMTKRLLKISSPREYTNFFVFFGMLDLSWFFISVSAYPQWWAILVPFIIAVLDNFDRVSNYIFALLIYNSFLFYSMRYGGLSKFLSEYILVVPIDGNNSIILVTLITATLVIWTIELRQEVEENGRKSEVDRKKNLKRNIILPLIILISPLAIIGLMPLIIDNGSPISNQAEDWNTKGIALGSQGNYADAIKAFDEAIKLDPNDATAWNNKGIVLNALGRATEANASFATSWNTKGIALGSQGNYADAIKAFDEAIKLDPNYAAAWNNKGSALNSQGNYDEAIQAYNEAIRLDPNYALAWNNMGAALEALGRDTEASTVFAKAKELGYEG